MTDKTYTFDELSNQAKDKAMLDWQANMDFSPDWVIDDFKEQGKERGFDIDDVRWSLGFSQGDGAAWAGLIRIPEFLDYHLKDDHPQQPQYMVLRELVLDGWVDATAFANYKGWRSVHSGIMEVDDIAVAGFDDTTKCSITKGVLQGADVVTLANSIDLPHMVDTLQIWMADEASAYADELYERIRSEYEYETSYDYFVEMAEANEWRFDENGKIV
jgi:hypothetical protein